MRQMYDERYIRNAMSDTKEGRAFWEPSNKWYFAVQRDYHAEICSGTAFSVFPVFDKSQLIVWPKLAKLVAIDFKPPYPNLVMLMHNGHCVWNWAVRKPTEGDILRIDLRPFASKPIVTIRNVPAESMQILQSRWRELAKRKGTL
jgi:hypothetical protein